MEEASKKNFIPAGRVLVIVPAYREGKQIGKTIADLQDNAPWADVLVIDDGSPDDTASVASAAGATVIRLPINLGVGGAMQTGYLYAAKNNYDIAIQFDGDGQHRADRIGELLETMANAGADICVGSRMIGRLSYRFPVARWLGSRLLVWMIRLTRGLKTTDPTSGFRAANRRAIHFFANFYPQLYLGDTAEALTIAARHGLKIVEAPTRINMTKTSSINNLKGLFYMARTALALLIDRLERPLTLPPELANELSKKEESR